MFSIIPFITLSLLLRVLQSPSTLVPQLLVDAFGMLPAALLLFLLLAIEMIFLLTMPSGRHPGTSNAPTKPVKKPLALPLIDSRRSDPLQNAKPAAPGALSGPGAAALRPISRR